MAKRTVGDTVWVVARFRDAAGTPTSPTTVTVTVRDPDGSTRTPTATERSEGVFDIPIPVLMAGIAYYAVEGEGNDADAVEEGSFCGVESLVTV